MQIETGITKLFSETLGAPLRNMYWSWGIHHSDTDVVILRVWEDEISADGHSIWVLKGETATAPGRRARSSHPGFKERLKHIELGQNGSTVYGVRCLRPGNHTDTRSRITGFIRDEWLELDGPSLFAENGITKMPILRNNVSLQEVLESLRTPNAVANDIRALEADSNLTTTERQTLIDARLGQGMFRRKLMAKWGGRCAATACYVGEAIRASHAKPWARCDNRERLDPNNGLPLVATLDALFDRGLIAFNAEGQMQISSHIPRDQIGLLQLPLPLRQKPKLHQAAYLEWHRVNIFKP